MTSLYRTVRNPQKNLYPYLLRTVKVHNLLYEDEVM